jgi:putative transposase
MPRQKRALSNSNAYHVMARGNEKRDIFLDNQDREVFLIILNRIKQAVYFDLFAYCLMNNHYHLALRVLAAEYLSQIMSRINTSYALYFNHKYKRVGHLFQGRFLSEPIDDDRYLLAVVRYIHNNPVKAMFKQKPEHYHWSSYNLYLKEAQRHSNLVNTKFILDFFTSDNNKAIEQFIDFSHQKIKDEFLDLESDNAETIKLARGIIEQTLQNNKISEDELKLNENKKVKYRLIKRLNKESDLSIRQIAELLKISKSTVHNVLLKRLE